MIEMTRVTSHLSIQHLPYKSHSTQQITVWQCLIMKTRPKGLIKLPIHVGVPHIYIYGFSQFKIGR